MFNYLKLLVRANKTTKTLNSIQDELNAVKLELKQQVSDIKVHVDTKDVPKES